MKPPHDHQPPPRLMTISQAAERLGCSRANVYGLINDGELPVVSIGRSRGYRIDSQDIEAFIQRRKSQRDGGQTVPLPARPRLKHIKL